MSKTALPKRDNCTQPLYRRESILQIGGRGGGLEAVTKGPCLDLVGPPDSRVGVSCILLLQHRRHPGLRLVGGAHRRGGRGRLLVHGLGHVGRRQVQLVLADARVELRVEQRRRQHRSAQVERVLRIGRAVRALSHQREVGVGRRARVGQQAGHVAGRLVRRLLHALVAEAAARRVGQRA